MVGDLRSRRRGRALEFTDYRAYAPGDDPRLVDWRAYARLDRLYLKQFDEEHTRTVTLLIDASASMDFGDAASHKGQYARQLAAALAWIARSHAEPVRTFLLRNGGAERLPPSASWPALAVSLSQLGAVRESGWSGLADAVGAALRDPAPGPALLVSDLLDPGWMTALDALAATGEGTVLQIQAPSEWEPPLGEEVELEDAETGELRLVRLGPPELAAYRARRDVFLSEIRARCRQHGIIHQLLNTGTPLEHAVLRQLTAAGILR